MNGHARLERKGMAIKGETASPALCSESVFVTKTITAYKRRDIAQVDPPSAFLHAKHSDNRKTSTAHDTGGTKTKPEVHSCQQHRRKNVLSTDLSTDEKAIWITQEHPALLQENFWRASKGRVYNHYGPCTANKIVQGKQITVTWHVFDLKILHEDLAAVTIKSKWLSSIVED